MHPSILQLATAYTSRLSPRAIHGGGWFEGPKSSSDQSGKLYSAGVIFTVVFYGRCECWSKNEESYGKQKWIEPCIHQRFGQNERPCKTTEMPVFEFSVLCSTN
jgi:hypothetical protein